MQSDPIVEWQRLSEVYRGMYDDELLNLAADANDLTETARQVLDGEMKKRGLALQPSGARTVGEPMRERRAALRTDREAAPKPIPDAAIDGEEYETQSEYTWKTVLCECNTTEEAQQLSEVLKRAGIENWIEWPGTGSRYTGFDVTYPRLMVAADQLEQAREIAAQPIPKDILEESKAESPVFEPPVCPKCGAADPVLEGVDPVNSWRCEGCGNEWTEEAEDPDGNPEKDEELGA